MRITAAIAVAFCVMITGTRLESQDETDDVPVTATGKPAEGTIDPFLGQPEFSSEQLFSGERFPNVVVTTEGTVLATWGTLSYRIRRSGDGGESWGSKITIEDPSFWKAQAGGVTVNERNGDILIFINSVNNLPRPEQRHGWVPSTTRVYRSRNDGRSWEEIDGEIHPDENGNVPQGHMAEHGITLRHGEHAGRLVRPARVKGEDRPDNYNLFIYSDDGGKNWHCSAPFPIAAGGEAALAELSDGTIYFNSRRPWAPEGKNPRRRWAGYSHDGGESWEEPSIYNVLPDGAQNTDYGCMGGLVRLPVRDRNLLLFSNVVSDKGRKNGHVWVSFDGGKTWPVKKQVDPGGFGYSSIAAGRPSTTSEGWIYLMYETYDGLKPHPDSNAAVARFNLSWVLKGKSTGDGEVPDWVARARKTNND